MTNYGSIGLGLSRQVPADASAMMDGYAAVVLLGGTAFIMLIFYMANAHVKSVHDQTWNMLMTAVSIFVAVMWNTVISFITTKVFQIDEGSDGVPSLSACFFSFGHILICWALVIILLYSFKGSLLRLKGYGTIGGHIMGFATIHFWGLVINRDPFRNSAWWIFPVVWAMYMAVMGVFLGFFHFIGNFLGKKSAKSADMDRWHDQAKDTGTDFFSLGQAFLITTWLKYLITGELSPAMADPTGAKEAWQLWVFGIVSLVFALISAVFALISHKKNHPVWCDFGGTIASTVAAMCLLDVWAWRVLPKFPDLELLGHMQVAFQLTLIAVGIIFIIALVHSCIGSTVQRGLRAIFTGLGFAVGRSWEKTFDAAVEALGDAFDLNLAKRTLICILLVCIVFPAWMVYILPKADDELKKEITKSPPVWAVCCDHDPCDEDEEEDWYEEADQED